MTENSQSAPNGQDSDKNIITGGTGVKLRLRAVTPSIVAQAQNAIPDPPVPMVEDVSRENGGLIPNPDSPEYLEALQKTQELRENAAQDAMIWFGVELVDPVPDDDSWVEGVLYLNISIEEAMVDGKLQRDKLNELLEVKSKREFLYKKYVACDANVFRQIAQMSGVTQESLAQAEKNFQRSEKR